MKCMTQRFRANTKGRDFIVGDIHGCLDEFNALLCEASFNKAIDRVFSVGDLADRGPRSADALQLLFEPWFHAVRGNHEEMLLLCTSDPSRLDWWRANGGEWARHADVELLRVLAERIEQLPYAIVVGEGDEKFNVIHAEFYGDQARLEAGWFNEQECAALTWGRSVLQGYPPGDLAPTFCGHTIVEHIGRVGSHVFIDTGAFGPHWGGSDGRLTMVEAKTGAIWSISAMDLRKRQKAANDGEPGNGGRRFGGWGWGGEVL